MNRNILLVAGEASGDMYGARLVREILKEEPESRVYVAGGRKMRESGASEVISFENDGVMGFTEILSGYFRFREKLKVLVKWMEKHKTGVIVPIDFAGFNLKLAKEATQRGFSVVYFIPPKVWAWGSWRLRMMKKWVRRVLTIFPFEKELYDSSGIENSFIGHPLPELIELGPVLEPEARSNEVLLFPGSRKQEIKNHLPAMLDAVKLIHSRMKQLSFGIVLAPGLDGNDVNSILKEWESGEGTGIPVELLPYGTDIYPRIQRAFGAIAKSGTTTLELALHGVPMVIIYKVSTISAFIARRCLALKNIGLPNIIHQKTVVPELLQNSVNGPDIAGAFLQTIENRESISKTLYRTRELLKGEGSTRRAAMEILSLAREGA